MEQRLLPLVQALRPHVPQVLLYGYMEKQVETEHVPDKARKTYARLVKENAAEEARRKKEALERKKQARKTTTKRRSR